jgi:hypothetical protein
VQTGAPLTGGCPIPWSETDRMEQRARFVLDALKGHFTMTELCYPVRGEPEDRVQVDRAIPRRRGDGVFGPGAVAPQSPEQDESADREGAPGVDGHHRLPLWGHPVLRIDGLPDWGNPASSASRRRGGQLDGETGRGAGHGGGRYGPERHVDAAGSRTARSAGRGSSVPPAEASQWAGGRGWPDSQRRRQAPALATRRARI